MEDILDLDSGLEFFPNRVRDLFNLKHLLHIIGIHASWNMIGTSVDGSYFFFSQKKYMGK